MAEHEKRHEQAGSEFDHLSVDDLRKKARDLQIGGTSSMNKEELIKALQSHKGQRAEHHKR